MAALWRGFSYFQSPFNRDSNCNIATLASYPFTPTAFSPLLIGIAIVTKKRRGAIYRRYSFQSPFNRDSNCNFRRIVNTRFVYSFSPLLIGIAIVTFKIISDCVNLFTTFSPLLIGIAIVTFVTFASVSEALIAFSPLLIGIAIVTLFRRAIILVTLFFQSPFNRDSNCNNSNDFRRREYKPLSVPF